MDIEKAREDIKRSHDVNDCPCLCKNDKVRGFIEGWESRQAEVDELHKILEKCQGESK